MNGLFYIFLLSLIPTFEGRYAIIVGIGKGYSLIDVLLVASLGILLLSIALPLALPFIDIVMLRLKGTPLKRFAEFYLAYVGRVRRKAHSYIDRWGFFGLLLFVALPLPGTGVWTGSLAAYIFGIEKRKTIPALLIGGLLSILITLIPSLGVIKLL